MKTKLLRKIRKLHPMMFDRQLRLYKYETERGRTVEGGEWEPTYNSGWERISSQGSGRGPGNGSGKTGQAGNGISGYGCRIRYCQSRAGAANGPAASNPETAQELIRFPFSAIMPLIDRCGSGTGQ